VVGGSVVEAVVGALVDGAVVSVGAVVLVGGSVSVAFSDAPGCSVSFATGGVSLVLLQAANDIIIINAINAQRAFFKIYVPPFFVDYDKLIYNIT